MRHFQPGFLEVLLSDGDEGLKWVREREFAQSQWLWIAGTSLRMCAHWCAMMKASIAMSTRKFSAERMVKEYFEKLYDAAAMPPRSEEHQGSRAAADTSESAAAS